MERERFDILYIIILLVGPTGQAEVSEVVHNHPGSGIDLPKND